VEEIDKFLFPFNDPANFQFEFQLTETSLIRDVT